MTAAIIIVIVTVLSVIWLDRQKSGWITKLLNWFPAILFAYLIPAAITHITGWDLSQVTLHQWSRDWIIPLAILSVMSALSVRQLRMIGVRPVVLFVFGSMIIATLPAFLVYCLSFMSPEWTELFLNQAYWKGLVPIVGSWIGGSTSQLVLKELVLCPEGLFLAILVLDNIIVNVWTILMFQMIKRSDQLNAWFRIEDKVPDFVPDQVGHGANARKAHMITAGVVLVSLLVVNFIVTAFFWRVVVYSLLGLALGNVIKVWSHALVLKAGGLLILLIMAILGLKLSFSGMALPVALIVVVVVWLILHFLGMLWMAKILRLHMAWVPIASMANLGGISTAPAVTAAYNEEWMPHAILLAILSMVSGTAWGLLTMLLFRLMI